MPCPKAPVHSQELLYINPNWSIQSSLEIKIEFPHSWFGPCIIDGFLQCPLCPGDLWGVIYYLVAHAEAPPSIKETEDKGISLSGEGFSYLIFLGDCSSGGSRGIQLEW